jgi:hypothetical protein
VEMTLEEYESIPMKFESKRVGAMRRIDSETIGKCVMVITNTNGSFRVDRITIK